MKRVSIRFALTCMLTLVLALACGDEEEEEELPAVCDAVAQSGCKDGQVCELVPGQDPACFAPVTVEGLVFDTTTTGPIEGAHVVARDVNDAAVSSVAVSNAEGKYSLRVPVARTAEGEPVTTTQYFIRADAAGYLTFPKPPRVALPVDVSKATGDPLVVKSIATDIGLIPLENAAGLGRISGKVVADGAGGTLIVAGGSTAIADRDGEFTVFNVTPGDVAVRGYLLGTNLESKTVPVAAGEAVEGVELAAIGEATAVVSGSIQVVNPGDGSDTSVILVVEETFIENAAKGEAPPGLRAANVSGSFEIAGVPDGSYVVLAAFENDFLVRDPDTGIGGTDIVHITVSGGNFAIPESFKVTGALAVRSPDAEEVVSGTPTFVWEDDSSEQRYSLVVFDALGNLIWEKDDVPSASGSADATQAYEGPALTSGMVYQFKATSWSDSPGGTPRSTTEDLKGVFIYE
jgi:hypothetical protein